MKKSWTLLSNHAHVLICIAKYPNPTLRQIAAHVGITERAAHRIVDELVKDGMVERTLSGRRNHYAINPACALRHPLEKHCTVGQLLDMALDEPASRSDGS